ncbi:MAG TPA: GspMb/PilO family protein [Pyrinomonadaceae bacterium]|nr:GspMb/PilO family protein [Pyrinomonadaceae bacterium]
MSQERPMAEAGLAAPRRQISVRVDQLRRGPALSILGLPELIGLACAALLVILVVFAYLYFYLPAGIRLKNAELDRIRLLEQRKGSEIALANETTTRDGVERRVNSLKTFEEDWLAGQDSGRMSLYTVLNKLIKSNGLHNTTGPSYAPLEPVGTKKQVQPTLSAEKQSNAKWQSIYPGIAVSVTVEGPYQNVRHFVRDLEGSHQFLIINAVELERVTQSGAALEQTSTLVSAPETGRGASAKSLSDKPATLVSLRIDLATYFQRTDTDNETP